MPVVSTVLQNANGGYYDHGKPFTESKWASISNMYELELEAHGKCSIRRLAMRSKVSNYSARKVIDYYESGIIIPPRNCAGHGLRGVGSLLRWEMTHHAFIYELYCNNSSLPVDGYVEEFFERFEMRISKTTVERWFLTIGPFKGTMRVTSRYPSARNSWTTINILREYLNFIVQIQDYSRLVFADEKPMKEIDVYRSVRRNPVDGNTPNHDVDSAKSKNRYSILAAVNVKGGSVPPVQSVIIEECTDSSIFLRLIRLLLDTGVLQRGGVFILDNCTIHIYGDNVGTQEYLFDEYGILMVSLPPYHPDFNPTELIFNTLLQRLSSIRARYKCWKIPTNDTMRANTFLDCITFQLNNFTRDDIMSFYRKQGYIIA